MQEQTYRIERARTDVREFETIGNFGGDKSAAVYHFKFYRSLSKRSGAEFRLVREDADGCAVVLS